MINRTLAPAFREIENIEFIQANPFVLDNGLKSYQIDNPYQDLVRIEFIFKNVAWDASKPLLAFAANSLLNDGTSEYTSTEIAEKIDYYGAFLQTDHSLDYSSAILYTLNKHLVSTLPIVKAILTDSVFPQSELEIFIHNQKQKLGINLQKNDFIARREFNEVLFGNTLYGHASNHQDYDNLTRIDLQEYFSRAYQAGNCTIILAGKITDTTRNLLNDHFGDQHDKTMPVLQNAFKFEPGEGTLHFTEKEDSLQSAIRIGQIAVNRKHPDFPGLQVLNTVLGGYFGSRLMANIREDKGYTYGIGSAVVSLENSGYFFIASEVGAEVCNAAIDEIEKEVNLLNNEPVPEAELTLVKNYLLGSMLGSLENAFSHADKFKNIHFYGLGYDYYSRYIETVKSITSGELLKLANQYLQFDDFEKLIVGKR